METKVFHLQEERAKELDQIACILKDGGLVALPTETVYGLAANIYLKEAVKKIFTVKGRPADNPLIVHISDLEMGTSLMSREPKWYRELAEAFWPGPLTMIVPKSELVSDIVSGGLDTVALRMPSHPDCRDIISVSGLPLAAPSANLSGKPSPTSARHVIDDLLGKIEAIVVREDSKIGIESTVISLVGDEVTLLRPGIVTVQELAQIVGEVEVAQAVEHEIHEGEQALSPGMKYKHYSPLANVEILEGDDNSFYYFCEDNNDPDTAFAVYKEDLGRVQGKVYCLGERENYFEVSANLFSILRQVDKDNIETLYIKSPSKEGGFLGVYNRMLRAAGFQVTKL